MPKHSAPTRVTIVLTQRERFSAMQESLSSLLENTPEPFRLVCATGSVSTRMRAWLKHQSQQHGFMHVEAPRTLTPPEARNLGLQYADTEYVVFAENDVVFKAGWLSALIACADETGADVVAPLTCEGRPIHTIVHHVGSVETNQETFEGAPDGQRDFHEEFYLQGRTCDEVADFLVRRQTRSFEMHCFLMRRDVFNRVGLFDPDIVSKEYLDFAWRLRKAGGGSIWVEPKAVVTFLIPSRTDPITFADLPYFLLRWSQAWQNRSHDALKQKWGLAERGFIASRRAISQWRIVEHVAKPALEKMPMLGRRWGFVSRATALIYAPLALGAAIMAWRYDRERRSEAAQSHAAS
ncbi:MAG TPA: glycosyltransferase [Phenylobacterium sp.]|uniref:glycosyltransferase family 2 protein n=1 Tax=Phenylobacterium sp. TaxID=1871053 RepID=UPI002B4775EA|nr:glycosyltransferase [Phenylobacterium sp.]HKR89284.1 glycosyltransferase [Phenylobacterium sp.]HKT54729.1 glycosyltransferase [Caulobacteraceae bacterium]